MEPAVTMHFEPGPEAARAAREAVRERLRGRLDEAILADMQLLVSEVVTNGIRHGAGQVDLEVLLNGGRALVRCQDQGPGFARVEPVPRSDGSGGYGLLLVDRLAKRWGIDGEDRPCIWFELAT